MNSSDLLELHVNQAKFAEQINALAQAVQNLSSVLESFKVQNAKLERENVKIRSWILGAIAMGSIFMGYLGWSVNQALNTNDNLNKEQNVQIEALQKDINDLNLRVTTIEHIK